jgi:hypothetical protein
MNRSGWILLATGGILAIAIVTAAHRLGAALEDRPSPTPSTWVRARTSETSDRSNAGDLAMARVADGEVLLAGRDGHLFLLGVDEEDRLQLRKVYQIRQDVSRHLEDPDLRSPTGWYLDDLAERMESAIAAMREEFQRRLAEIKGTAEEMDALTALAEGLADRGEIPYLTKHLEEGSYFAQRAAGIALGRRGYRRAAPALIEVTRRGDERSRKTAGEILAELSGIPCPATLSGDPWGQAIQQWGTWARTPR